MVIFYINPTETCARGFLSPSAFRANSETRLLLKDAMLVSFRSKLFTSYILTIFKQQNILTYEQLPNIVIHACKNNTEKLYLLKMCPAYLALFIYVWTHCVETVKWLDYNRDSQLTRWCSGNASALGERGPGFNPRLR